MQTSNPRPFSRVFSREIRRISGSWPLLFLTLIGPVLSFLLVMWIFSSNIPRDLPVAVVDLDHTALSRKAARMVDAAPIAAIHKNYLSLEAAKKALEAGTVDAVLLIQEDCEKSIMQGNNTILPLYLNNANVVKGGLLTSGIRKALATLSTGIKMQMQMKAGASPSQALAKVLPIQLNAVVLFNPYVSYSYFLTSSLFPLMLIVFTLLGSIYAIGIELKDGSGPDWLNAANKNIFIALAGKLLPYTLLFMATAMLMNSLLFNFLDAPLNGKLHLVLMGEFFMIIAYQSLAIFLLGLFSNLRLSLSLGSAYTMMALTFSGLTFPLFGMPAFAQAFARIFPFTYWLQIFISQSLRGEPAAHAIGPMFAFWAFIGLGLLFIPRLKYLLLSEKNWGKL